MNDDIWDQPVPNRDEDETAFWRDQRADADEYREQTDRRQWFNDTRAEANKVPCRDCKRPAGKTCQLVTDPPGHGQELNNFPAHVNRIVDARKRFG